MNGVPDDCDLVCSFGSCDMSVDIGNGIGADFVLIEGGNLIDPLGRYSHQSILYDDHRSDTRNVSRGLWDMIREMVNQPVMEMVLIIQLYVSWHMAAHLQNTLSIIQSEQECYPCTGSGVSVLARI